MPWTVLGRKWHLMRKGFPPGKKIEWEPEVLEELLEMLSVAAPNAQTLWNHMQVVNMIHPHQREPWARIATKKPGRIELALTGPKGHFSMGRIADLGHEPEFDARPEADVIKLHFCNEDDLHRGDLASLLTAHAASIQPNDHALPLFRKKQLVTN
jgi:excinuclease ABC subunit A